MPIELPTDLPAARALAGEGLEVSAPGSVRDGERRLQVALLNLMPDKPVTETQIARLLGATPYHVQLTLVVPDGYRSRHTPGAYLERFYQRFSQVRRRRFDALIVTGAPLEHLAFEEVRYWGEFTRILDWAAHAAGRAFFICWAAQAALAYHHGVGKRALARKCSGVFLHTNLAPHNPLMRGMDRVFTVPVSRHSEVSPDDLPRGAGLEILASSARSGLGLVEDRARGAMYMFNHLEYDADTLGSEYRRDRSRGLDVAVPVDYFPGDDPRQAPANTWRHHAHLLFRNWLREAHLGRGRRAILAASRGRPGGPAPAARTC